jgi:lysophospholipase L1-like esterase
MLSGENGCRLAASSDRVEAALESSPAPDAIYFLGDSITLGWRDESLGGWPSRLLRGLHAEDYAVTGYNLGIRGDTSSRIADRWEDEVGRRRRDGNDLLVFAFGVNDATLEPDGRRTLPIERTVENLRHILRKTGRHPVMLIGPAPIDEQLMQQRLNARGNTPMPTPASIAETSARMAAEAATAGVPYLDLLAALAKSQPWHDSLATTDGLHPSSAGHDLIAAEVRSWGPWQRLFPSPP